MKPLTIHPCSALLGAGALALVALATSAQRSAEFIGHRSAARSTIEGIDPSEVLLIREEDGSFHIAGGKRFVVLHGWTSTLSTGATSPFRMQASVLIHDEVTGVKFLVPDAGVTNSTDQSWKGRFFLDGPTTIRVEDASQTSAVGRLTGLLVDVP